MSLAGPPDFEAHFPRAVDALETAIRELLAGGWEELRRRRAHEIATALRDGSKIVGWKETGGILHAMTLLLELPLSEVISRREALRDRLLELLELLQASAEAESA